MKPISGLMAFIAATLLIEDARCAEKNVLPTQKEGENPAEHLPRWITRLTRFGERADWSHDGKKILFLEKTYGDVFEVDVAGRMEEGAFMLSAAPPNPTPPQCPASRR